MSENKTKVIQYVKKRVGRPKKEVSEAQFDKKKYMKEYMKKYNDEHKEIQLNRRNTAYYIEKFNIEKEFSDKYGIYTGMIYKCMNDIKKINQYCPLFVKDIDDFVKSIIEKEKEKKEE